MMMMMAKSIKTNTAGSTEALLANDRISVRFILMCMSNKHLNGNQTNYFYVKSFKSQIVRCFGIRKRDEEVILFEGGFLLFVKA